MNLNDFAKMKQERDVFRAVAIIGVGGNIVLFLIILTALGGYC